MANTKAKTAKTKTTKAKSTKAKSSAVLTHKELVAKYEKQMATYQADIDKQTAEVEAAIGSDSYAGKLEKLKDYVKAYNKAWIDRQYCDICEEAEPLVAAINQLYVKVKAVKEEHPDGDSQTVTGVKFDTKTKKIDLKAFATFAKLDKTFWTEGLHLFDMIQLYHMHGTFNLSRTELLKKTPYFERIYNEQVEKDTPVSNRQLEKAVTNVVDLVYPHEHRNITFKYDVNFFLNASTKYDKKADAGIASVNPRTYGEILISALHNIIGDFEYTYAYVEVK